MSKIIFNKIIGKLERLDEYLKYLAEIQKTNKNSFLRDYHFHGLAERYLQLAIEILLDIGKLTIIAEGLRRPEDNQDIFSVLCETDIISKTLARRLTGLANFRNILVHDYEKIDREIVYDKLQKNLTDFRDFKKEIVKYVKRRSV